MNKEEKFLLLVGLIFVGIFSIYGFFLLEDAFAQEEFADDIVDQVTEGVEEGIKSIIIPDNNIIDTDQKEVDDLAESTSAWLESFFDFGKKTHAVTEDAMAVGAPSWIDPILISFIAGAVVILVMWRVFKKVGIHIAIAFGILAAIVVFLMLLDLNS